MENVSFHVYHRLDPNSVHQNINSTKRTHTCSIDKIQMDWKPNKRIVVKVTATSNKKIDSLLDFFQETFRIVFCGTNLELLPKLFFNRFHNFYIVISVYYNV